MQKRPEVTIRLLREEDLPVADRILRLAFGTFLGLPDPIKFMGDADYVRTRWLADPSAVFGAELAGKLVGTNFATRWGSVGFFGPLTIQPDLWERGIAQQLLRPVMQMEPASGSVRWTRFGELAPGKKQLFLQACADLTSSIYEGLDVQREISAVDNQKLGDTVLIWDNETLAGFAVCHAGAGTEAGSGKCYIKFGAVRSGRNAAQEFRQLLDACHEFARSREARTLVAGVNLARLDAYREMLQAGFRTTTQGVAMQRNADPGYNRPDVFLIDDWR